MCILLQMRVGGEPGDFSASEISQWYSHNAFEIENHTMASGLVQQVQKFLPPELAEEWHQMLLSAWGRTQVAPHEDSEFLYTTNDAFNGDSNDKVRSNHDSAYRRFTVRKASAQGLFAYSKWELGPEEPLVLFSLKLMKTKAVRELLQNVTGKKLREVQEHFVTAYSQGDFLNEHADNSVGSLAWVVNLSKDWAEEHGGQLRFTCRDGKSFNPEFNSLILFQTRPWPQSHEVRPVETAERPRFAITGWYLTNRDQLMCGLDGQELMT